MARGTSVYDIARIAGVSAATVSNVLNGKGRVSQKTRDKVLQVARREGYVANISAKNLRGGCTRTIGIVTPDVSNDFFSNMILSAEESLHELGYSCFICDTRGIVSREDAYLQELVQKGADGILFAGGTSALDASRVPDGIPFVCVDRHCADGITVENDTVAMLRDMTAHLLDLGCMRVAYLNTSTGSAWTEHDPSYVGYVQALRERGLEADPSLAVVGPHLKSSHTEAEGLVSDLLRSGVSFDGIAALGDRVALGALRALEAAGIDVGTEVRLVGADNSLYSRISFPAISSVERHVEEMAYLGAQTLVKVINNEAVERQTIVPHEVIARETTVRA